MKIHEYQARDLFVQYGIPAPKGYLALSAEEAVDAAKKLGKFPVVVKAQIHSGGRGKAGGVKLCHNEEETRAFAADLIGKRLPCLKILGRIIQPTLMLLAIAPQFVLDMRDGSFLQLAID